MMQNINQPGILKTTSYNPLNEQILGFGVLIKSQLYVLLACVLQ